ncbi:hypothetical protein CEXT_556111 [Caerostris extrusa]|uniref:Reverse transcriptase domain-containing protein n=1 Tax=Caerostris extrusa TaxID=172846 RepID=A0AAV4RPW1_CAEEX|nr:hypothetical protein CEXT_556111 [Caerostris extrusa]
MVRNFGRNRSTKEQATFLSQCIKDGFYEKISTLAVYLDFKNAYDKKTVYFNHQVLGRFDTYRYLGLVLYSKLLWKKTGRGDVKEKHRWIETFRDFLASLGAPRLIHYRLKVRPMLAYVRPVLEYGGQLIATASNTCSKIIDMVQNKALKLIIRLYPKYRYGNSNYHPALKVKEGWVTIKAP